jgi:hypothetical protein
MEKSDSFPTDNEAFCAEVGSPTRARTWDLRINSPSLYQLSYRGFEAEAGLYGCYQRLTRLSIPPKRVDWNSFSGRDELPPNWMSPVAFNFQ